MKQTFFLASLMLLAINAMAFSPLKKGAFETGQYRNLLVDEGRTVHGVDTLVGGKGDRTADDGTSSLDGLHDFLG